MLYSPSNHAFCLPPSFQLHIGLTALGIFFLLFIFSHSKKSLISQTAPNHFPGQCAKASHFLSQFFFS